MNGFVKSGTTDVPVDRSSAALQKLLKRYGASGFGISSDYEGGIIRVFFRVPDHLGKDAAMIPVRLEVDVKTVYTSLHRRSAPSDARSRELYRREWEQAERVAWRNLMLWVDAALSAAAIGVQRISEAFLAHTLVSGADGKVRRVVDQMDEAAGGNWRGLLAPPSERLTDA